MKIMIKVNRTKIFYRLIIWNRIINVMLISTYWHICQYGHKDVQSKWPTLFCFDYVRIIMRSHHLVLNMPMAVISADISYYYIHTLENLDKMIEGHCWTLVIYLICFQPQKVQNRLTIYFGSSSSRFF